MVLAIETNVWSCIYRICDLSRIKKEQKRNSKVMSNLHTHEMYGYSSAADEYEEILLTSSKIITDAELSDSSGGVSPR